MAFPEMGSQFPKQWEVPDHKSHSSQKGDNSKIKFRKQADFYGPLHLRSTDSDTLFFLDLLYHHYK